MIVRRVAILFLAAFLPGCGMVSYLSLSMLPLPVQTGEALDYMRDRQYDKAFDLLRTRASLGDVWANAYTAGLLGNSDDVPKEIKLLVRDRLDRVVVATAGSEPWGYPANVPMDIRRRFRERMDEAIAKGDVDARYILAMKYLNGRDSLENLPEAIELLNSAASEQHRGALLILGLMDRRVLEARGLRSPYVGNEPRK